MTGNRRIIVLASGNGSNFQSIADKIKSGELDCEISCLLTDKEDAFVRERAQKAGIPDTHIDPKGKEREAFDKEMAGIIDGYAPDLIVLAGYMRLLSPWFVKKYAGRIINIHPALLPAFPGTDGYGDAWKTGVKVSGCTVHFVDEGLDTGPIILQKINCIEPDDTLESFKERGLKIEHEAYPEAIRLFLDGRLQVKDGKVQILR